MNTWVKNQLRDAWVDSGVHDGRIECSRSPEYAHCTLATMANYEIEVSSTAEKQLRKLSPKDQISVLKRIQELGGEPRPNHSRKPWGQRDIYRVRAGNYRILYSIEENYLIIIILKVGQRRDVYR